ncbi:MAG: helix-turn-helix domain-containing protein [Armatimonadetes bacterium]|nr:helix-turn-helix domain-containing protein [Armatimonadota bacterium]
MERLLPPEEAAERLAVTPKSIREWLRKGKLRGVKAGRLWRIRAAALEQFLNEGRSFPRMKEEDPILTIIGCLSGEPLSAKAIETELYGTSRE